MLKHGRAGIPMEVMGLMLGEFIDDYTIRVVDVFSMPQSGNTVSVEAVDPAYQAEMLEMLKRKHCPATKKLTISASKIDPEVKNLQNSLLLKMSLGTRSIQCIPMTFSHFDNSSIIWNLWINTFPRHSISGTGRPEVVVGWYHSHPGFGCWFSGTDVNTQQSFEQLNRRAVGVVVDPIQSVKGKVVIDCFRLINPHSLLIGREPRQTTSNVGHLQKPTITALVHGLNRHYYSLVISYRKGEAEQRMLTNFNKANWAEALRVKVTKMTHHV